MSETDENDVTLQTAGPENDSTAIDTNDSVEPEVLEPDVAETDAVEPDEQSAQAPPAQQSQPGPTVSTARWIAGALSGLLLVSVLLSSWLYFGVLRGDQQLGPAAEQAVMAAAADGAVAVLTYAPKTMEQDFAAAESHLTGDFLAHYTDFTQKVVTPAVKEKEVQTVAAVVRKGVVSLHPNSAEVLIYLNQTTISKANPDGSFSMSAVKVGLEKHDGRWLISSFDPV